MKKIPHVVMLVLATAALLISACGGAKTLKQSAGIGGGKPQASLVEFTGVIEAINGDQWTVNGQNITITPTLLQGGNFSVGDSIKGKGEIQADGSLAATEVETSEDDGSVDNINDNTNDSNFNENDSNDNGSIDNGNSNDDNFNDNSQNDNFNDNSSNDNSQDDNFNDNEDDQGDDSQGDNSNDNGNDQGDDNSGSGHGSGGGQGGGDD